MNPPILPSIHDILVRIERFFQLDPGVVLRGAVRLIAIWALAWLALRLVSLIARRIERAMDDGDDTRVSQREKQGQTISQLVRSVGRVAVLVVALLLTANLFINIGPLLAGAGILGLAVSFGAQSLVKDVISGFFILVENQLNVGDVVEAAGKSGVVEKLTIRMIVLRDVEGTLHFVPNGEIKTISNRTRGWSRAVVDIGVAYEEDVDRAIEVVRDEALKVAQDDEWKALLDGLPEVWGVESLSDNAVVVRVVAKTQPGSHWGVARELRRRLKNRFQAEGIEIPYPQRKVSVRLSGVRPGDELAHTIAAAGGA